ncbi:hypothetical protein P879_04830 [Paragonimus westermani]|uniref:Uncharacterized protein n=1 Tax=Paragonimus westermani TaxID=34504 RepID=A0A8T0DDQ1_9TREM|nr:hypothetical protein P879_04830 [Paragonimus westermani]
MLKITHIFNGILGSGNTKPSENSFAKCGLYHLKLSGTMFLNNALLTMNQWQPHSTQSDSILLEQNPSRSYQSVTSYHNMNPVEDVLSQVPFAFTQFVQHPQRLLSGRFSENRKSSSFQHTTSADQYRDRASCAVELSDFNKSLGSSGEFDNILRVHSSCLKPLASYWGNGRGQKPDAHHVYSADRSIFLLGTFLFRACFGTNSIKHNCLQIFQQFGSENAIKWTAYVFPTPQCQYKQTEAGGTIVSVEHALAWMDLKAGRY